MKIKQIQKAYGNPLSLVVIKNDDKCLYGANIAPTQSKHNQVYVRVYPRRFPHRQNMVVHKRDVVVLFYLASEEEIEQWLEVNFIRKKTKRC